MPDLAVETLGAVEILFIAAPGHPLAGRAISPRDLIDQTMLCTNGPSSYGSLSASLSAWGIAEQCEIVRFGDAETVKRGVEIGLGLAQLARVSVARELAEGRLTALRLDCPVIRRDLLLVQHKHASQSTAAGVFASFLRAQADTLLGGL